MPEQITLSTPFQVDPATPRWVVWSLLLRRGVVSNGATITFVPAQSLIKVELIGENGQAKSHQWTGVGADADIVALNKVNLSTGNTLNKRILDKLIAEGVIAGTLSGTAD